jgi:hypothetical protein
VSQAASNTDAIAWGMSYPRSTLYMSIFYYSLPAPIRSVWFFCIKECLRSSALVESCGTQPAEWDKRS